ncbi:helix-turn-helix transcriptional regulator [Rhizobium sophorae]|uniref:Helix-turn-helix transcriptional regulator n=2 Tax=Rhizobium sophorae TaxID=1535242 RepID=A0A7Y3S7L5_9HYPH|nr:helix-turn-helix transcriptional regulator [Rhizobium bangladeshense]NKL36882.1 transcriptional regulator [Rhizobium leguminosarum bv. viciae]NNU38586.1 helix-turn-helix transcriptional regulator [Rhizobium sophorae]
MLPGSLEYPMRSLPLESANENLVEDRLLLDEIASKWTILVLGALCDGPLRFNELKRRLDGVTQKALTQCLRRLEANGIIERHIVSLSPIAVAYEISALGRTLEAPLRALHTWTLQHRAEVMQARERYKAD